MKEIKTKSIENIEKRLEAENPSTMRYKVLENAKSFKTSWIGLGQILYAVWRDKLYKNWGFTTFEAYTAKEIGIRKQTALKLVRSYHFLEKEEPRYVTKDFRKETSAATIPTCDSVDVLRLASKKKSLDTEDYSRLKESVLEKGKDVREIKKDLTSIIKEREELDPDAARKKRRAVLVKRFISTLKSINNEAKISKMLPAKILKETDHLIKELESELS